MISAIFSPKSPNKVLANIHLSTEFDSDLERGKKIGNSYFIIPYSVYYNGEWKGGRPHGVGDVVFQNGSVLKGSFYRGKVRGKDCILIMDDGSYYRGNMDNNCFCGKGKFVGKDGHSYEGLWDNNQPHGLGV